MISICTHDHIISIRVSIGYDVIKLIIKIIIIIKTHQAFKIKYHGLSGKLDAVLFFEIHPS